MSNTGDTLPGSADFIDAGSSAATWDGITNILVDDSNAASANLYGFRPTTDYLVGENFGFSIPAGSTINGIEVKIKASAIPLGPYIYVVQVYHPTLGLCDNKSSNETLTESNSTYTYGGSTDLHGKSWTYSDINNSAFGACVRMAYSNSSIVSCYVILVNVYYTGAGGSNTFCQSVTIL